MRIHILGICGTFMAGVAGLAIKKGYTVTGQDKSYYSPMKDQLCDLQITENITEDLISDLVNCDIVIIGNSQSRGSPSVEYVLDNKLKYFSGPEWIKENILKDKFVFVVSGTHGKTTTTSMLIKILEENNLNPSFLVGGIYKEENISYKYTDSKYFIIEGDEYDTSFFDKRSKFIHYKPNTLIINNLEYDHSDIFDDIVQIKKQFHFLIRTLPKEANIIFDDKDENILSLLSMGCWSKKISYYKNIKINNIIGEHNFKNSGAAISAAETIGISKEKSIKALEKFCGVKRRLEKINNKNFILYDDFAHHPTEILASYMAIKKLHAGKKIFVILQIESNSMIAGTHKEQLINTISEIEICYIFCKKNISWINSISNITVFDDIDIIVDKIKQSIEIVDIVILMSNGDTSDLIMKLTRYE